MLRRKIDGVGRANGSGKTAYEPDGFVLVVSNESNSGTSETPDLFACSQRWDMCFVVTREVGALKAASTAWHNDFEGLHMPWELVVVPRRRHWTPVRTVLS